MRATRQYISDLRSQASDYKAEVFNLCNVVDPQKFQARVADPTAQGPPASTFRTLGWARTCLIKIAYLNDIA